MNKNEQNFVHFYFIDLSTFRKMQKYHSEEPFFTITSEVSSSYPVNFFSVLRRNQDRP